MTKRALGFTGLSRFRVKDELNSRPLRGLLGLKAEREGFGSGAFCSLGFGVPYFNTFFSYRNHYGKKSILFSPWLLQSLVQGKSRLLG